MPHWIASQLEVLERLQGDVQEVARAAGGVEHADRAQAIEEGLEDAAGFASGRVAFVDLASRRSSELGHLRLHRRVLAPERAG